MGLWLRHVRILLVEELWELLGRGRILLVLVLFIGAVGSCLWALASMQQKIGSLGGAYGAMPQALGQVRQFAQQAELVGVNQLLDFFARTPAAIWMFQFFSLIWFPILTSLVSFDMIARDTNRGTHRYLLQRTTRSAYVVGKIGAHVSLYFLLYLVTLLLLFIVCMLRVPQFPVHRALEVAVRYTVVDIVFFSWIVSATALVSSLTKRIGAALLLVNLMWGYLLATASSPWLSPIAYENSFGLLMPELGYGITSFLAGCAWTAIFLTATLLLFRRRAL